jgi:hypothetical protein
MTEPLMRRPEPRKPWGVIVVFSICAIGGLASVPLNVAVLKQGDAASRADVLRNQELTARLAASQDQNAAEAKAFREDSRRLTLAICSQIEAIVRQTRLTNVPPCPRVQTSPTGTPSPAG